MSVAIFSVIGTVESPHSSSLIIRTCTASLVERELAKSRSPLLLARIMEPEELRCSSARERLEMSRVVANPASATDKSRDDDEHCEQHHTFYLAYFQRDLLPKRAEESASKGRNRRSR